MHLFILKYYLIIIIISIFSVRNAHPRLLLHELGHLSARAVQGLHFFGTLLRYPTSKIDDFLGESWVFVKYHVENKNKVFRCFPVHA